MKFLWTGIYVKNLDESIAFYSDFAGLRVINRFPAGPGLEIAFMGNGADHETMIELLADEKKPSVNFSEYISIGFAVDSVDAMLETIRKKHMTVHIGPIEMPRSKFFYIKDPNGLNVQFFQQKL
jgi:lactoylglutathione lyase